MAPLESSWPMLQWLDEEAASASTSEATMGLPVPTTGMPAAFAWRTTPLNEAGFAGSWRMAATFLTMRLAIWSTCLSTFP